VSFPDHHNYNPKDVESLSNVFVRTQASYLITTEKDAVKLEGLFLALPILVLQVEIEWLRGKNNLERELFKLFT
jgi:tetraacyldisaccharide-1-P 4'-kinase